MPFASKTQDWRRLPTEARESFLAALRERATVSTAGYLSPIGLAAACGLQPDPWQAQLLESQAKQVILNCSRQSGKSTVTAIMGLHQCLYTPESLVLLLSPSLRQSQELFRKVKTFYDALETKIDLAGVSALRLEFANGSRCINLPAKEATIRGYSGVSLLVCDEASRIPDELYMSCRPMLAVSGGRVALLSTPNGRRGFFYEEWESTNMDWLRIRVTASECPRISEAWLASEKERIGSYWFQQEYETQFSDTVDQIFSSEDVLRAITNEVQPLWTM